MDMPIRDTGAQLAIEKTPAQYGLPYIQEKYTEFRNRFFGGDSGPLPSRMDIRFNNRSRALGTCQLSITRKRTGGFGRTVTDEWLNSCVIYLSNAYDFSPKLLDEVLTLDADQFTAVDADVAVTGEVLDVEGTPFDFRTPTAIGDRIDDESNQQIVNGHGYDHNWILNTKGDIAKCFGTLFDPNTGIKMEMFTDQPGLQFYAGNFLDGSFVGKKGVKYPRRSAFCFETQHYPDSPNHPEWPTTTLRPGEKYQTTTIYRFSVEK